tara:strand:- start:14 stop:310 length:297 start_codon:yes stop_codon:yes gene_type:complete
MKFRPLHDRVLIKVLDSEEKTAGGIIIPDSAKEKPQEGEVVAIGPGIKNDQGKLSPLDVKVGDIVLFGKWSGNDVKIDGKEYSIMKEADIMGISKRKK